MRHILVDYARARHNLKRGGEAEPVSVEEGAAVLSQEPAAELVALDEALERACLQWIKGKAEWWS